MPGWRFQWRITMFFVVFGAALGFPMPVGRAGNGGQSVVLTPVVWQNVLLMAVIGFLIGSSLGGFVNAGYWWADDGSPRPMLQRFSLRGLLFVLTWVSLLLGVIVFIAKNQS